jgi:epoxyqueuosine reductase
LNTLSDLDEEDWESLVEGSPVRRATRDGFVRNALIALGNRGGPSAPAERALSRDEPEVVKEAAAWALEKLRADQARRGL